MNEQPTDQARANRDGKRAPAPAGRELRRTPRYPASTVWSDRQREAHREQRDAIIRDAGLDTDARAD